VKIRDLPGWPPSWTETSGGPRPVGIVGVFRSVEWRVDLRASRDLCITIEYQGHLWCGLYPGAVDVRERFDALSGDVTLDRLHQMLSRYAGDHVAVSDLELPCPTSVRCTAERSGTAVVGGARPAPTTGRQMWSPPAGTS